MSARLGLAWILAAALALAAREPVPAASGAPSDAAEQIAGRYGLVKITGRVWGLTAEQELRTRLRRVPELRERIVTAQKELDEQIAKNEAAWRVAAPAISALDKQLKQLSSSDPQRRPLAEQLARLKAETVPPADLGSRDAVRTGLARLGQDRCLLALDVVWIRRTAAEIEAQYRELAGDADLALLVKQSGEKCRLGPARNYQVEIRRLHEYDALAFAPHAPVYLQSGRLRLTAVVNDSTCTTFSWSEASDAVTYLPASLVRTAGIDVPADARTELLRIGGRPIEAREVFLPSLRLGSCHAKSVSAFVLPPEAEDLGAQLTPLALSPCRLKIERAKLRVTLE